MKNKYYIINIIISIMFVISYNHYFFIDNTFASGSIFNLLLFIFSLIILRDNKYDKSKKLSYIYALLLSISLVLGKVIYDYNNISMFFKKDFIINIISLISFTKIIGELVNLLLLKVNKYEKKNNICSLFKKKYIFFLIWGLIFISWLPVFLAYYPGVLSYDSPSQTYQAFMGISSFNNLNPVLHTLLWYLSINISNALHLEPLAFYSIIQMLFLSFALSSVVKLIINKNGDNWIIIISLLFFALNPSIAIFSFSMTKDIFFTGFFVLFILELFKIEDNYKYYFSNIINTMNLVFITTLMCLFRNNGILVVILVLIIYFIKYKYLLFPLIISVVLYSIIISFIYPAFKISKGSITEGLSISMQQISFAVKENYDELSSNDLDAINNFIPIDIIMNKYNPRFADPIKSRINSEYFLNNLGEYFSLYTKLLFKYPLDYISAFLSTNLSYWYIDGDGGAGESSRVYIETNNYVNYFYNPVRNSKFPWLLEKYEKIANYEAFENKPLINYMFSITLPLWLTLLALFVMKYKKSNKTLVVISILVLWAGYLLGPVSNFRYIFPLMVLYPLLLFLVFDNNQNTLKN